MDSKFKPGDKVTICESSNSCMAKLMRARVGDEVTIKTKVVLKDVINGDSYGYVINEIKDGERRVSPFGFIWPEDSLEIVSREAYSNAELDDFFEMSKEEWLEKYDDYDKWERMRDSMRSDFKEKFFEKAICY